MKKNFYGYKNLVVAIVVMIAFYGIEATLPIMFPFMAETFQVSADAVGLGMTISGIVLFASTFISGFVIKKIGIKFALLGNMIIIFASILVFYFAQDITTYYIGSAIKGVSGGVYIAVCMSVLIANWFNVRRATLIGLAFMCSSLGSSLFLTISGKMLQTMSWQNTYMIISAICFLVGGVAALFVRNSPNDIGQRAKGELEIEQDVETKITIKTALKSYTFWAQMVTSVIVSIFILMLPTYASAMWFEAGMEVGLIGLLLTGGTMFSALCNFCGGIIADKFGKRCYVIILYAALFLSAVFTIYSVGTLNMPMIILSLVMLAISNPIFTTMYPIISFDVFAGKDYEKIIGFIQGGIQIGIMLMPILVTATFSLGGTYKTIFVIAAAASLCCLGVLLPTLKAKKN